MCQKLKPILLEQHNAGRTDEFYTTFLFWDCECEDDYVHPCTQEECLACGTAREEAPDARVNEVFSHSLGLNKALLAALEFVCDEVCPGLAPIPF